jgi:serine/threonine-protein phosphatase PPG1
MRIEGLSPSIQTVDQMRVVHRFSEIPHEGVMADLVWSDPMSSSAITDAEFTISPRGAGYLFSGRSVKRFLERNELYHIMRAHQLCMEGYQVVFEDTLSTVWYVITI